MVPPAAVTGPPPFGAVPPRMFPRPPGPLPFPPRPIPPNVSMPLTEEQFYREKKRLLEQAK